MSPRSDQMGSSAIAGTLVWELFTPLAALRFLHLHAEAADDDLLTAVELSQRHAAYFIACTTPPEEGY